MPSLRSNNVLLRPVFIIIISALGADYSLVISLVGEFRSTDMKTSPACQLSLREQSEGNRKLFRDLKFLRKQNYLSLKIKAKNISQKLNTVSSWADGSFRDNTICEQITSLGIIVAVK